MVSNLTILLTKTNAAQNEDAHSYHSVRGIYYLAVVFVGTIINLEPILRLLFPLTGQRKWCQILFINAYND